MYRIIMFIPSPAEMEWTFALYSTFCKRTLLRSASFLIGTVGSMRF
jgi:hypothetical protein